MNGSAVTSLLSLFLGCLGYQLFIYYKPYFPILNADSFELWTVIITCALVPVAAILLAIASTPRPKTTRRPQTQPIAKLPELTQQEEKLCRQLIGLLNGDQDAAQWMFYQSKQNNPDKNIVWHLEQVIQDVEHHYSTQPTAPLPQPPHRQQQPAAQSRKQQELEKQLVNLLHGDYDTAQRLLQLSLEKNGDRDMNGDRDIVWHLEKVIYDLVRDRGGKPDPKPYIRDYRDYRDC